MTIASYVIAICAAISLPAQLTLKLLLKLAHMTTDVI